MGPEYGTPEYWYEKGQQDGASGNGKDPPWQKALWTEEQNQEMYDAYEAGYEEGERSRK